MASARVVVVTATYRRPRELAVLLGSLGGETGELAGAIVIDNAADATTNRIATDAPLPTRVITPGSNLGCGGGVALGLSEVLADPAVTHAWIFDDDAQATPGAMKALLTGLAAAKADAAVPLIVDEAGCIGWFPGPLEQPAWNVIRQPKITPTEFRVRCGVTPRQWMWAPWPSLLVTRGGIERAGLPRSDFWFQGEDLEWTLRLSVHGRGVLMPTAECRHLPPVAARGRVRLKQAAMLQNNVYTATRLSHGRRALRHIPGNLFRFLRAERFSPAGIALAWRAHWLGGVRGLPAGAPGGDAFRRAWMQSVQ